MTSQHERELRDKLEARGWFVVRGAGSMTMDLVACRPGQPPILIEQKTAMSGPTLYLHGERNREQWRGMHALASAGHRVCYAVRFRASRNGDDGWRFGVWGDASMAREPVTFKLRGAHLRMNDVFGPVPEEEVTG